MAAIRPGWGILQQRRDTLAKQGYQVKLACGAYFPLSGLSYRPATKKLAQYRL